MNNSAMQTAAYTIIGGATPISNAAQLAAMTLNGNYILTANISLSGTWTVIGPGTATPFIGTFNGNGHTITFAPSLVFVNPGAASFGLFGMLDTPGLIKNLRLEGSISLIGSGNTSLGPLVGFVNSGTIRNISSSVSVTAVETSANFAFAGGIVANNFLGTIENSYSTGNIRAENTWTAPLATDRANASGIAATGNNGTYNNTWTAGTINALISNSANTQSNARAAGITNRGTINNSVALTTSIVVTTHGTGTPNGSRISNEGTRSNNHALNPMTVTLNGMAKTLATGVNAADGADVTLANANTLSWWRTTAGWTIHDTQAAAQAAASTGGSPWYWSGGTDPRPILWFETTVNRP